MPCTCAEKISSQSHWIEHQSKWKGIVGNNVGHVWKGSTQCFAYHLQNLFKLGAALVNTSTELIASICLQLYALGVHLKQCCQPCGFPANLGLFFVELWFFLKTWGLLVFGLVLIEICLFYADFCFADCFFFKCYGTFAVSMYSWRHIGRDFVKICPFGACFFGFATRILCLISLLIFRFVEFSWQRI